MLKSLALAAGLLLGAAAPSIAADMDASAVITNAIDGFVRPAYRDFHAATSKMSEAAAELCAAPSPETLEAARNSFGDTVDAWSRAEIIRFGPITEQNRLERILFWPDRKSTGLKQVQAALHAKDATAADPDKLPGKSVAMQGLGALEFVLFGTDADRLATTEAAYRCAFGSAISANLDAIADEMEAAWAAPDGFARTWAEPAATNALYRDDAEALGELLDVFVTGLELDRDVRLGGFLGKTPEQDKPRQALFWRSERTIASVSGNLSGMKSLFEASGLGDMLPADTRWIVGSIGFEFSNALDALASADGPVAQVLADPKLRGKLDYAGVVTSSLSELFGTRVSGELGLTAGFSSLDGD
jgi:predicted lipoprotein